MPSGYEMQAADLGRDREQVLAIWGDNLGSHAHMASKFDWFYRDCPMGDPLLIKLHHRASGEWVGAVAVGRRKMLWCGQPIEAAVMVDFAVAAGHRSFGPALILKRKALAAASERAEVVYAFPNERAAPIYPRAGYRHLADLVRYARVLRHGNYLARHLPRPLALAASWPLDLFERTRLRLRSPRMTVQWSDHAIEEMDRLWSDSPHGHGLITVRDTTYLRWRLDRFPFARTRYLLLRDDAGRLCAWFACQRIENNVLNVYDYWSDDALAGISRARVDTLLLEAFKAGHAAVWLAFAGTPAATAGWLAAGFRSRASRPLFVHSRKLPLDAMAAGLHITAADEDE